MKRNVKPQFKTEVKKMDVKQYTENHKRKIKKYTHKLTVPKRYFSGNSEYHLNVGHKLEYSYTLDGDKQRPYDLIIFKTTFGDASKEVHEIVLTYDEFEAV